jgi:hypothetical protein
VEDSQVGAAAARSGEMPPEAKALRAVADNVLKQLPVLIAVELDCDQGHETRIKVCQKMDQSL